MKIVSVRLHNVQSHPDTVLKLSPGVTYIIGATNSGKSAIRRAIRWCLFGGTEGLKLRRKGQSAIEVEIEFDTGHKLLRKRSNSENLYVLHLPDGSEHPFENVDRDIPPMILKELGFKPMLLDGKTKTYLNVSEQHEGPFLLTDTPGTAQLKLGVLTRTDELEQAAKACDLDHGRTKRTIDDCREQITQYETTVTELGWVDQALEYMPLVEKALTVIQDLETKAGVLASTQVAVEEWNRRALELAAVSTAMQHFHLEDATAAMLKIREVGPTLSALTTLQQKQQQITVAIQNLGLQSQGVDSRYAYISKTLADVPACPTCLRPFDRKDTPNDRS